MGKDDLGSQTPEGKRNCGAVQDQAVFGKQVLVWRKQPSEVTDGEYDDWKHLLK